MMEHPTNGVDEDGEESRTVEEVIADAANLYSKKNDDYGDSWRLVGKTMALWLEHLGEDELRVPATEEHLNSFGLFTRRLDKMIREWNGWMALEEGDEYRVDESIVETHEDDVPYSAMHTTLAEQYSSRNGDPE